MKVIINNKETETQAKTVKELAQELDLPATGCAVAISNEMVPRDEWESHLIQEGCKGKSFVNCFYTQGAALG